MILVSYKPKWWKRRLYAGRFTIDKEAWDTAAFVLSEHGNVQLTLDA